MAARVSFVTIHEASRCSPAERPSGRTARRSPATTAAAGRAGRGWQPGAKTAWRPGPAGGDRTSARLARTRPFLSRLSTGPDPVGGDENGGPGGGSAAGGRQWTVGARHRSRGRAERYRRHMVPESHLHLLDGPLTAIFTSVDGRGCPQSSAEPVHVGGRPAVVLHQALGQEVPTLPRSPSPRSSSSIPTTSSATSSCAASPPSPRIPAAPGGTGSGPSTASAPTHPTSPPPTADHARADHVVVHGGLPRSSGAAGRINSDDQPAGSTRGGRLRLAQGADEARRDAPARAAGPRRSARPRTCGSRPPRDVYDPAEEEDQPVGRRDGDHHPLVEQVAEARLRGTTAAHRRGRGRRCVPPVGSPRWCWPTARRGPCPPAGADGVPRSRCNPAVKWWNIPIG